MSLKIETANIQREYMKVNSKKGKIDSHINVFRFKDKETKQYVYYAPSIEITGYGSSDKKAQKMFFLSLGDYCNFLFELSPKKREVELTKVGWKKNKVQNKEFSRAYVDLYGQLQDLNFVAEEVVMLTVDA
jgi:hypothetical protein